MSRRASETGNVCTADGEEQCRWAENVARPVLNGMQNIREEFKTWTLEVPILRNNVSMRYIQTEKRDALSEVRTNLAKIGRFPGHPPRAATFPVPVLCNDETISCQIIS